VIGQEQGNIDFVIEKKFGEYKSDTDAAAIATTLSSWLKDSEFLNTMSRHAMDAGRPHAAEEIARNIGTSVLRWKESHPEVELTPLKKQLSEVSC
jgi:UDP-N-acetylglucosamine:LPS N-acetylglucosamine transferase